MNERHGQMMERVLAVVIVAAIMALPAMVQAGPPTLSTNPGKHVIFPAKGQTPEQQKQDEIAAYEWATQQTGWDPYEAADQTAAKGEIAEKQADSARGGAVKGALGGALMGVAIGAIAGDAGTGAAIGATAGGLTGGARSHRTRKAAGKASDTAVSSYAEKFATWDRCFVAAMEGKGYTVK